MKFLSLSFVFLYAFINQNASAIENVDVFNDQVWVYPVLTASHQLMQERGGANHFLNTQVVFNSQETQAKVEEAQAAYPGRDIYLYKLSYVEAKMDIPNLPAQALRYSEQMDGWELKANYQKIPDTELANVRKFLSVSNGLKLVVGHYKRSLKDEEVYNTHCLFGGSTNEGIPWLFRRLKAFEKDVEAVMTKEKLVWETLLNDFSQTCTTVDARGANDFKELSQLWRVKGKAGKFAIKVKKMKENYRQVEMKPQSSLVIYEF